MALPAALNSVDQAYSLLNVRSELYFDEFTNYTTAGPYTTVNVAGSGTVAAYSTGGVTKVLITTGATSADSSFIRSTTAHWLPQLGRPLHFETKMNYANQATTNAVIVAGLMSATTLTITSGTTIPSASYSGSIIYKLSGDTTWRVQTSNGATKSNSVSTAACTDGEYVLGMAWQDRNGSQANVVFTVNGHTLVDSTSMKEIEHVVSYASLADMYDAVGAQCTNSAAQLCYVDYMGGEQWRLGLNF